LASSPIIKLVRVLKAFIDNRITSVLRSVDGKLENIRLGPENLKVNAISSRHLSINVTSAISYSGRNFIRNGNEPVISNQYLINQYEATELLPDLDYTFVIYGLVNEGQQIMVTFNDGVDGEDIATFINGYAVIHTHTPLILENENVQFYNYPFETATIASIGWVCMYREKLKNPPMTWNIAPEDLGEQIEEATTSISILGGEINAKLTKGELNQVLNWSVESGIVLGRVHPDTSQDSIDLQLMPEVLNFRKNNVPVVWFGLDGFQIREGTIDSRLNVGNYVFKKTADGGFMFG
jgi:hypothetical protein